MDGREKGDHCLKIAGKVVGNRGLGAATFEQWHISK
jgi:hypothetical protein